MSQSHGKSKENGTSKAERSPINLATKTTTCPPGPHSHPHHPAARHDAGDDNAASEASHPEPVPENIFKCINALKNIHLDVQKTEQEMYSKLFLIEAEHHKKMLPLLKKRADVISGKHLPTKEEGEFSLKNNDGQEEVKPEIGSPNDVIGVPDFWLDIFSNSMHTATLINEEDREALKYLMDVRCVYGESPLGFTLEFEFKENPFFTNLLLTRSYQFGTQVGPEELYISSGLAPKITAGCQIDWKKGKDTTKKEQITYQRNKKTGARREMKSVKDQDSFFQFFQPKVTDLATLSKVVSEEDEADADELAEKAEQAEMDFELASYIRTRVIPRALLIYTGDDEDDDMSYGDEEEDDYDDEDDGEEEEGGAGDMESDSDDEDGGAVKKPSGLAGKSAKIGKQAARRS